MLRHLSIKNYALIHHLEVAFYPGFAVITGETGAGKSIILGALALILGQRAEPNVLMDKNTKCVVEGHFQIKKNGFEDFFQHNNLEFEPEITILRREILPSGKSRAFINDTPVNLVVLKQLAEMLIDIHSQHQTIVLQNEDFQMDAFDSFAGLNAELSKYGDEYKKYQNLQTQLKTLTEAENQARTEQDFIRFQYDELEKSKLTAGEQIQLEQELDVLNHAGEIKNRLQNAVQLLQNESNILSLINSLIAELRSIKSFSAHIGELYNRIESSYLELKDVVKDLENTEEKLESDPEKVIKTEERLNLIYHLEQKHRVDNVENLIKIRESYHQKLVEYSSLESKIRIVGKEIEDVEKELTEFANRLSEQRNNHKASFENQIISIVSELGMPQVQFRVEIEKIPILKESGHDKITFLFSANRGGELQEIANVASGGELSRLMLAVKSLTAGSRLLSTIIFDEIDSGVSGEIAGKMGSIMQKMASKIQILTITHLPQIASKGENHYLVYKNIINNQTHTFIRQLPDEERIAEIAKMLSDSKVSQSAVETARELLKN